MSKNKKRVRPPGRTVRFSEDLNERIDKECAYLSVTRNAWLSIIIDKELRRAQIERSIQYDPDIQKNIKNELDGP